MEDIYQRISSEEDFGEDDTEKSEIQEFFDGQTVLLTGCTGFLGKCIVEKLLRSCPGIKKLYLLIRPKRVSPNERLKKYFEHLFFDRLLKEQPNFQSKVAIIEGNLIEENLDISDENRKIITENVTIIFHNGSNVKFDPRISESLRCNVMGTKYLLDIAKECKNILCFVYISTAYSHCYRKQIGEECYPITTDLTMVQDYIRVDERTPTGLSDSARAEAVRPWPNVYSFSKSAAEALVDKVAKDVHFPCVIFRPSIIVSTYQEPIRAWCGNFNGPAPVFLATGLGALHFSYHHDYTMDFVPADMSSNAIFAITWDAVTNRKDKVGSAMVFNYGSSTVNPQTSLDFKRGALPPGMKTAPSSKMVGPDFCVMIRCIYLFWILHIIFHFIPAIIADICLLATFRKPVVVSTVFKISQNLPQIHYWINGNWRIHVRETQKVWDRMNKRDSILFFNDLRKLEWRTFLYPYWRGLRVYVLGDPMSTVEAARRRFIIIRTIFAIVKALLAASIAYYVFRFVLYAMFPLIEYALPQTCKMYG